MPKDQPVTLAAISGAVGVTGEVRLKLFGEGVDTLKKHKSFNGGTLTLKTIRSDNKGGAVARFAEITDRNEAEKLRSTVLEVARDALPPLGDGEYYHADLIGLPAISASGKTLGTVVAIENYGASDVIEVERLAQDGKSGQRFMVPMNSDAVPDWSDERLVISDDFADI